jgi:hypothetical protein
MRAQGTLLGALAIAGVLLAGVATDGARAQSFGRAYGPQLIQVRDEGRHEGRGGEGRGRGQQGDQGGRGGYRGGDQGERSGGYRGQGDPGERGGYRGQPYAPAPRGYAYPAPAYPYRQAAPPPNYAPPPQAYAAPPAYAQPRPYSSPAPNSLGSGWLPQQPEARRGVGEGTMRPLGDVVANIQRTVRGRMLDAGVEPGPDGRPTYRVRWAAAGGRRIDFIVDAATGAIIGQSGY